MKELICVNCEQLALAAFFDELMVGFHGDISWLTIFQLINLAA
jgi:hypothetical protein